MASYRDGTTLGMNIPLANYRIIKLANSHIIPLANYLITPVRLPLRSSLQQYGNFNKIQSF